MLKSTGTGTNLSPSNLSAFFKLFELVGTFFNWSISNLSTLEFELAKSTFSAKFDISTFALPPEGFGLKYFGFEYSLSYTMSFL